MCARAIVYVCERACPAHRDSAWRRQARGWHLLLCPARSAPAAAHCERVPARPAQLGPRRWRGYSAVHVLSGSLIFPVTSTVGLFSSNVTKNKNEETGGEEGAGRCRKCQGSRHRGVLGETPRGPVRVPPTPCPPTPAWVRGRGSQGGSEGRDGGGGWSWGWAGLTNAARLRDLVEGLEQVAPQLFDVDEVVEHGVGEVHQVVQVDGVALGAAEGHVEYRRLACAEMGGTWGVRAWLCRGARPSERAMAQNELPFTKNTEHGAGRDPGPWHSAGQAHLVSGRPSLSVGTAAASCPCPRPSGAGPGSWGP